MRTDDFMQIQKGCLKSFMRYLTWPLLAGLVTPSAWSFYLILLDCFAI